MTAAALAPCPICRADAAKPRVGALGEPKGVWCTQCGHAVGPGEPWSAAPSESEPPVYPWPGHSALLDALARNAISRPQGMTDEDFRVVLNERYNATKPNP